MPITNAEWKIMELLWEKSPRTITELTRSLKEDTGWTKQTIINMLRRMEEKGRVKYEESSKAKLFYPTITKDKAEKEETDALIEKAFSGSPSLLISTMIQKYELNDTAINDIINLIGEKREK